MYTLTMILYLWSTLQPLWGFSKKFQNEKRRDQLKIENMIFIYMWVKWSCSVVSRLLSPRDFPGKTLEWVAIFFSRGSSQLRDQTLVSHTVGTFFTIWATHDHIYMYSLAYNDRYPLVETETRAYDSYTSKHFWSLNLEYLENNLEVVSPVVRI